MSYPTKIDLCDGKYSVTYNFQTGQSECLRYGEKWRELCGDKMVLAMFDRIVELEEGIRQHLAHHENGCTYLSHLVATNPTAKRRRSRPLERPVRPGAKH